ncbi:MAG TPA: S1-like domain-containing RNA-binding protein [Prolixibacteraceae bacterium]|nr:S1-like domain-containing RNA-binding protein [Prolixibacteraceae bacterium]
MNNKLYSLAMAEIGKINHLYVVKEVDFGIYLDGGDLGEILMPKQYVPEGTQPEDMIDAFIYLDSEDRLVATTLKPKAMVEEFALLEVVSVTQVGAFLDWGLLKDLFVPFREQRQPMEEGKKYLVYVYLDLNSKRIAASSKIENYLDNIPVDYDVDEDVDLIIVNETDLGYNAIIDNSHLGILYKNEVFQTLNPGDKVQGFIKKIRTDGKIDLSLVKAGYEKISDFADRIIAELEKQDGFLSLTDKSSPEEIYKTFKFSKKNFKAAVGALYKKRMITLEKNGIRIVV